MENRCPVQCGVCMAPNSSTTTTTVTTTTATTITTTRCAPNCPVGRQGDRSCDLGCMTATCGYDKGDCAIGLLTCSKPDEWSAYENESNYISVLVGSTIPKPSNPQHCASARALAHTHSLPFSHLSLSLSLSLCHSPSLSLSLVLSFKHKS